MSPVNGPASSALRSSPPIWIRLSAPYTACAISIAGTQTSTSISPGLARIERAIDFAKFARSPCIFQLPAISVRVIYAIAASSGSSRTVPKVVTLSAIA